MKTNEIKIHKKLKNKVYLYKRTNKNYFFYVGIIWRNGKICKIRRITLKEFLEGIK